MTFREYLAVARPHISEHQDFVADALADGQLPDVTTWTQLRLYLFRRHGCREAMRSAFHIWTNYQQAMLRRRAR